MSQTRHLDIDTVFEGGHLHIDLALVYACFRAVGWYRHEIDEQVTTWFALRAVERWAQRALVER